MFTKEFTDVNFSLQILYNHSQITVKVRNLLVLPLFLILFSSTFIQFSYASVESEAQEDIQAGCRDGNTLVYRFAYKDYVCVAPSTADRWEELGLAEIVDAANQVQPEPEKPKLKPQFEDSPPPQKQAAPVTDDSQCRDGYTLVFRFIHHDTFCTSPSTAASWERLGLAEIITPADNPQETVTQPEIPTQDDEESEEDDQEIEKQEQEIKIPPKQDTSKKKFTLPAYPNQPSINPKLKATNDFWSPPQVHKVTDNIWVAVGYDIANSIMIEGEKGIIIVDTLSTYENAKKVLKEFRKITDKPVKTIIYTHGHLDHVQGAKAFLEEGDDDVEIVAHESLLDSYINENSVLGPIASIRSTYVSGAMLPAEDVNMGVFPPSTSGTIGFVPPTDTFSDTFSLDISSVKMKLFHVGGESSDQIYVWLPEEEVLIVGDNVYGIFPNIYTLRGAEYRDPMAYVNALDQMIPLNAEHLIPSHVKPVSGKFEVSDILTSTRDATQYIYDQTIRGMNNGYTADELAQTITLPEWFANNPWLTEARGQIPWHVKQIYYGNLGWFQGDPAFLLPVDNVKRSEKIVDAMGGPDNAIKKIRTAIDQGEYAWAAELATYVITANPDNDEAKFLKAYALRVIGQQMLSADGRHWALTSALELEGKITVDPKAFTQTSPEQLASLPIEKLLKSLSTKIDPEKTEDESFILNVIYTDLEQDFTLHFRNGILAVSQGLDVSPDHEITLDSQTHKLLVSGNLSLDDAIKSGKIKSVGNTNELKTWLGYLDPLTVSGTGIRG